MLDLLHKNGICVIFIPGGCIGELQPLDISVNDYKKQLKNCFSNWYVSKIQQSLSSGTDVADISVDLRTSVLKPVHARWLIKTHADLAQQSTVITDGFTKSGIQEHVEKSGRQVHLPVMEMTTTNDNTSTTHSAEEDAYDSDDTAQPRADGLNEDFSDADRHNVSNFVKVISKSSSTMNSSALVEICCWPLVFTLRPSMFLTYRFQGNILSRQMMQHLTRQLLKQFRCAQN